MDCKILCFVAALVLGLVLSNIAEANGNDKYEHHHVRDGTWSHRQRHHGSRHHYNKEATYHHHVRSKTEGSDTEVEHGSWTIQKRLTANHTITITYNSESNFFGTWDKSRNLASIQAGTITRTGIYNATSQVLFIVDTATNLGTIIKYINIDFSNTSQLQKSFNQLYEVIALAVLTKSEKVPNMFNVTDLLNALQSHTLHTLLTNNTELVETLANGLEGYVQELEHNVQHGYNVVSAIWSPLFQNSTGGVLDIFKSITNQVNGLFSPDFARLVFTGLTKTLNDTTGGFPLPSIDSIGMPFEGLPHALTNLIPNNDYTPYTGNGSKAIENKSWSLNSGNSSNHLLAKYNPISNILGIFNAANKISTVFNGNSGSLGLFNTTSGVGLVENIKSGVAKVVTANSSEIIKQFRQVNKNSSGFQLINNIIKNNLRGLDDWNHSESLTHGGDVFNLKDLIQRIDDQNEIFSGRDDLAHVFYRNFGSLLDQLHNAGGDAPTNFLRNIFGSNPVGKELIKILSGIFTSFEGQFNPQLMWNAFEALTIFMKGVEGIGMVTSNNIDSLANLIEQGGKVAGSVAERIENTLLNLPKPGVQGNVQFKVGLL